MASAAFASALVPKPRRTHGVEGRHEGKKREVGGRSAHTTIRGAGGKCRREAQQCGTHREQEGSKKRRAFAAGQEKNSLSQPWKRSSAPQARGRSMRLGCSVSRVCARLSSRPAPRRRRPTARPRRGSERRPLRTARR
eukprot:2481256-Pleurochrysis_carterae.AAC.1